MLYSKEFDVLMVKEISKIVTFSREKSSRFDFEELIAERDGSS